jgi:TetR/AcrR family transcriptional regulator, regulator of autoinduction and epiphytic fitness
VKEKAPPLKVPDSARKGQILDAALITFLRFGFRKTSMENVAHAAQLSRQALYLHFATKEELFCAALSHYLEGALRDAAACLAEAGPLPQRLLRALDAWVGRTIGISGEDISDLHEASSRLAGSAIAEGESAFLKLLTRSVREQGLPEAQKAAGFSARQVADAVYLLARGLKYDVRTRDDFLERLKPALRWVCLPLEQR